MRRTLTRRMGDFFQRLRERKLVQWALAYVAASFALIQVLDIVAQRFGWPEQTVRFVIVAMCVGFFATLVIAWYHGERGAQRVSGAELLILTLLLAIGGAAIWRLAPRSNEGALASNDASPATAPADPKSIAVLPFVNMSGQKENDYFSDGISEEILNVLAGIPDLRVAARTSSFSFRDGKHEAPEIAQELHVRMLLEGSVRKQGDRARITAQLIDASNGYHLWSQTYDRDLKDIFAIQDEIAAAIANELKVKISGAEDTPQKKPHNVEAYDFYLRGLGQWQTRGEAQLLAAIKNFESAAAADPQFAEAYAGLGLVYTILPDFSSKITYTEALARAENYAELALSIDPSVPEIYPIFGYLADSDRRRKTAQALYRRNAMARHCAAAVVLDELSVARQFDVDRWRSGRRIESARTGVDARSEIEHHREQSRHGAHRARAISGSNRAVRAAAQGGAGRCELSRKHIVRNGDGGRLREWARCIRTLRACDQPQRARYDPRCFRCARGARQPSRHRASAGHVHAAKQLRSEERKCVRCVRHSVIARVAWRTETGVRQYEAICRDRSLWTKRVGAHASVAGFAALRSAIRGAGQRGEDNRSALREILHEKAVTSLATRLSWPPLIRSERS
jgi:TolB-like protein